MIGNKALRQRDIKNPVLVSDWWSILVVADLQNTEEYEQQERNEPDSTR